MAFKVITVLTLIFRVGFGNEAQPQQQPEYGWEDYELGNGQLLPDTPETLATVCAARGDHNKFTDKLYRDVQRYVRFVTELKPTPRTIAIVGPTPINILKGNWMCIRKDSKLCQLINSIMAESRQLKLDTVGHIWDR